MIHTESVRTSPSGLRQQQGHLCGAELQQSTCKLGHMMAQLPIAIPHIPLLDSATGAKLSALCCSTLMFPLQVWVLTGDKLETAISIGVACRLLAPAMRALVLRNADFEALQVLHTDFAYEYLHLGTASLLLPVAAGVDNAGAAGAAQY